MHQLYSHSPTLGLWASLLAQGWKMSTHHSLKMSYHFVSWPVYKTAICALNLATFFQQKELLLWNHRQLATSSLFVCWDVATNPLTMIFSDNQLLVLCLVNTITSYEHPDGQILCWWLIIYDFKQVISKLVLKIFSNLM